MGPNSAEGPKNGKGPPMGSERAPRWVGDAREAYPGPPARNANLTEKDPSAPSAMPSIEARMPRLPSSMARSSNQSRTPQLSQKGPRNLIDKCPSEIPSSSAMASRPWYRLYSLIAERTASLKPEPNPDRGYCEAHPHYKPIPADPNALYPPFPNGPDGECLVPERRRGSIPQGHNRGIRG